MTAVKFPHFKETLAKNSKLALLKQLSFLHAKFYLPFGFAEVLPHPSGDVSNYLEAKASLKKHRFTTAMACFVELPRHIRLVMLKEFGKDKNLSFYID